MRTTLVIGHFHRETKRGDLLSWAKGEFEARPYLPAPIDTWPPHRKGSQIKCKFTT